MTKRKMHLSLLYAGGVPVKWLKGVAAGVDSAVGMLCANQWQTVRIAPLARPAESRRRTRVR